MERLEVRLLRQGELHVRPQDLDHVLHSISMQKASGNAKRLPFLNILKEFFSLYNYEF